MRIKKFLKFGILTLGLAVATTSLASCSFSDWFFGNNDNNISERQYDVEKTVTVISTLEKAEDTEYFLDQLKYGDGFITNYEVLKDTYTDAYYEVGKQKEIDAKLTLKDSREITVHFNINIKSVETSSELVCGKDEISISPYKYETADDFLEDKYFGINTNGGVFVSKGAVSTDDDIDVSKLGTYNITLKYGSYSKKVKVVVEYQTYKLTFNNTDGSVLKVVDYNEKVRDASGLAPRVADLNMPRVESEKQNTEEYVFEGWDTDLTNILEDCVINPIIKRTERLYTVTFLNYDGTVLDQVKCKFGSNVPYLKETPTKEGNQYLVYDFVGWSVDTSRITSNTTATARFRETRLSGYRVYSYLGNDYAKTEIVSGVEVGNIAPSIEFNKELDETYDPRFEYSFIEWVYDYTTKDGSTEYYKPVFSSVKTKAKIEIRQVDDEPIETIYINLGEKLTDEQIKGIEQRLKKPTPYEYPELYNYNLNGWSYDLAQPFYDDIVLKPNYELVKEKSYLKIYSPNGTSPFMTIAIKIGENINSTLANQLPNSESGINYTKEPYSNYCYKANGLYYVATKFVDFNDKDVKDYVMTEKDYSIKTYLEPFINETLVCSNNQITYNSSLMSEKVYIPSYTIDGKPIQAISKMAFASSTQIKKVYWNNSFITAIPESAFYNSSVEEFIVGTKAKIKSINENAFASSQLRVFGFGNGVYNNSSIEIIDRTAFANCAYLTNIHLNEMTNLRYIGVDAFKDDVNLKYFSYQETTTFTMLTTKPIVIESTAFKNTQIMGIDFVNSSDISLGSSVFYGVKKQVILTAKNKASFNPNNDSLITGQKDENGNTIVVKVVYTE